VRQRGRVRADAGADNNMRLHTIPGLAPGLSLCAWLAAGAPANAAPDWPTSETPCFGIERVALRGEGIEAFAWLAQALEHGPDAATGRCLGAEGLSVAAARAQQLLIARGFVTSRVRIEPQDVSSGTLTLSLLPGRVGAIRFAEGGSPRARPHNLLPVREGDVLNLRDIEQALENLRRVPTVQAEVRIAPGTAPGLSEPTVHWTQALPWRLRVSLDDSGSRATGRYQAGLTLGIDHALGLNDLFQLGVGRDLGGGEPGVRGTRNASLHYSLPWGYTALGLDASRYRYFQQVPGLYQDYRYSGEGAMQSLTLSRVVQRNAVGQRVLHLKAFARQSRNFIDDTEVEVQSRRSGGWELGAEWRHLFGHAPFEGRLGFRRGTGAFGARPAPEEAFGEGRSRFALLSLDATWSLPFDVAGQRLHWHSQWRGQRERTPLTPQDRFAIGGRYSVRGFDGERSLLGERGWWWRNELRWLLGDSGQQLYAGVDQGRVGGPSARRLPGRRLAGAVLGLRGGRAAWSYEVFIGVPLHQPEGFRAPSATAGFQLGAGF